MVPPVPAPAMMTSTLPEEGCNGVDGVKITASMISGPVVYSWANGLLTLVEVVNRGRYIHGKAYSHCDIDRG